MGALAPPEAAWSAQRERGSAWLIALMVWLTRNLGWHVGRALLVPITLWFYATSAGARGASRAYLARVLGRPARARDVARHLWTFACVILDRVFFLSGRIEGFEIKVRGLECVSSIINSGRGCVLLGSHLGSFDVLRVVGRTAPVRVSPAMFRLGGHLTALLATLDPELARDVIEIGAPGAMLRVRECLERGEIVSFLADRAPVRDRMVEATFLGVPARFPAGPLVLAAMARVPVVLCYGVWTGPRRYSVWFEPFAERIELPREQREAALRHWGGRYAASLEAACRAYPFNWFNFYDFWARDEMGRAARRRA